MTRIRFACFFLLNLACLPAMAADSADPAAPEEKVVELPAVTVTAGGDLDWKPYRTMLKGLDAFDRHRQLAPAASARFVLRPQQAALKMDDVTLGIVGPQTNIDIPVAADGVFALPRNQAAIDENAELVVNRKKGLFLWRPYIRSPNLPAEALRLGDLRLECEMRWAVEKEDSVDLSRRALLALLGGPCKTSMVKVRYPVAHRLAGATLVAEGRSEPLSPDRILDNGLVFAPPLHDRSWPDDTLVELRYVSATQAP